jgi:arylsulfatase A-like enzyme
MIHKLTRRSALKAMTGAGVSALAPSVTPAAQRPDVLFIAVDDLNNWLTLYDPANPIKTPNLERLAKRGVFFSNAYAAAPMCNPSRTAVMTGLRPTTTGVYTNGDQWRRIVPGAVTLSQQFMKAGYFAACGGKIFHHGLTGADDPHNPSFRLVFTKVPERAPAKNYNGFTERPLSSTGYDFGEHNQKMTDVDLVEWATEELRKPSKEPMFLATGIFRPHLPFYAPPEFFKMYPRDKVTLPPMPEHDLDDVPPIGKELAHTEHFLYQGMTGQPSESPGSLHRFVQSYQAAGTFADAMVGRLLDALDSSGRTRNTIIVLWADNGYHLGDKENCVKFTLWEKSCNVPMMIVAPGVAKAGGRCSQPVSLVDLYPTLLELASLPVPAGLDGQSLVPLLKNPDLTWDRPALMTSRRGNHAVRSRRWRYIHYNDGTEELYDHEKDPWEWTNLAKVPQYSEVMAAHKAWLPKQEAVTPELR